jgi:hypothetical protein
MAEKVAKFDPKLLGAMVLMIVGAILYLALAADLGILGAGFLPTLLILLTFPVLLNVWKLKPEGWLGAIVLYSLLLLMALMASAYIQVGFGALVIFYMIFIRDVFGIKFKKEILAEEAEKQMTLPKMKPADVAALSSKLGLSLKDVKCPKCSSVEVAVAKDASGVCQSCKYGIIDIRNVAHA